MNMEPFETAVSRHPQAAYLADMVGEETAKAVIHAHLHNLAEEELLSLPEARALVKALAASVDRFDVMLLTETVNGEIQMPVDSVLSLAEAYFCWPECYGRKTPAQIREERLYQTKDVN